MLNKHVYHFQSNNQIQSLIDDFDVSYKPSLAALWLDTHRHLFPYHLLISHALRSHDQEILSLARFFLTHLDKQMRPAPAGQAYLGTKLPAIRVRRLQQYRRDDAVAFQCFLPVTQSRANAFFDATKPSRRETLVNVLFKIETNNVLCLPMGDTFLIDMATPFRIQYITRTQGNNGSQEELVIIKLIALNKNERERLFEQFKRRQENLKKKSKVTPRIMTPRIRLVLYSKQMLHSRYDKYVVFLLGMVKLLLMSISVVVNGLKQLLSYLVFTIPLFVF